MGMSIYEEVTAFANNERKEALNASKKEKNQVTLNPNSYMAKEIKYQTALLQQVLHEVVTLKVMLNNKKSGTNTVPQID